MMTKAQLMTEIEGGLAEADRDLILTVGDPADTDDQVTLTTREGRTFILIALELPAPRQARIL